MADSDRLCLVLLCLIEKEAIPDSAGCLFQRKRMAICVSLDIFFAEHERVARGRGEAPNLARFRAGFGPQAVVQVSDDQRVAAAVEETHQA
jgi:hypothetical protein